MQIHKAQIQIIYSSYIFVRDLMATLILTAERSNKPHISSWKKNVRINLTTSWLHEPRVAGILEHVLSCSSTAELFIHEQLRLLKVDRKIFIFAEILSLVSGLLPSAMILRTIQISTNYDCRGWLLICKDVTLEWVQNELDWVFDKSSFVL